MAHVYADRVQETSTTTGTGTLTLAGAVTGYQSFSAIGDGNTCDYVIELVGGSEWEVGTGTYTASGTTLARTTVRASSNAGSAVNFSAGTKLVYVAPLAFRMTGRITAYNIGTLTTGTTNIDPDNGRYQYLTNNGAHTLSAPTVDGVVDVLVTNAASAGAITLSGFTAPTGGGGDTYATTNTEQYLLLVRRINSVATYAWKALQ